MSLEVLAKPCQVEWCDNFDDHYAGEHNDSGAWITATGSRLDLFAQDMQTVGPLIGTGATWQACSGEQPTVWVEVHKPLDTSPATSDSINIALTLTEAVRYRDALTAAIEKLRTVTP